MNYAKRVQMAVEVIQTVERERLAQELVDYAGLYASIDPRTYDAVIKAAVMFRENKPLTLELRDVGA